MKKRVKIIDNMFDHVKYSTLFQESEHIEWDRNNISSNEDLVIYTDYSLKYVTGKIKTKVAWLLESPDITALSHQWIYENNKKFDYVLTHSKILLEQGENFIFCPTGGCWIKPEDQQIYEKNKLISIIASNKRMTHGQRLRHDIIRQHKGKMDIYGRAYNYVDYKLDALKEYMFSVTIENANADYYFTEKLIDCFMTGTVPIYFGPPSIGNFFNVKGMILFEEDFDIDSISADVYESMKPYIKENFEKAKNFIMAEDYIYKNFIEKYLE